jgi:hypothetical protein
MVLVADVFDVSLIDNSTGYVYASGTLTEGDIDFKVNANEVRAGKGNSLIGVIHSGRDITLTLTDAEVRDDWIAAQMGQDVLTGAGVAYAAPKFQTVADVSTKPTVTLGQTPITDTVKIYNANGEAVTGFTVTDKAIDFTSATPAVAVGDEVEIRTYQYATPATTQTIEIDNTKFAKDVTAILSTWEIDEDTEQPVNIIQYQFTNAKPDGNFSVQTKTERTAITQQMVLQVLKPKTSNVVGKYVKFPYTAEYAD